MAESIKYEKEIKELFSILREEWMCDEEWEKVLNEIFNTSRYSIEEISQQIEVGVKNGYPVGYQLMLCKMLIADEKRN